MRSTIFYILVIILTLAVPVTVSAQYSVNVDTKTVAAMTGAYATETAAESFYNEQVKDILKHYTAAEVAAAGIFSSKYLDRQALTELGVWSSATENYYYRRIYNLVSAKIMPKIWNVGGMMLKSPHNALYWGSYLMKVCDETKSLCMQFESVVTNSTLSFKDIAFLQISEQVADILRLSELGGVDFRQLLDGFAQIGDNFTVENLKADIDNLYKKGLGLASAGFGNMSGQLLQSSNFKDLFNGKLSAAVNIVDNYSALFHQVESGVGPALLNMIGGENAIGNLFNISDYNLTSWVDDYAREGLGQYYRQRWYIYKRDYGTDTICHYIPPTDKDAILDGSHWYRIDTSDENFWPNATQREAVLANSERHAGCSRTQVNAWNNANDGFYYSFNYYMQAYLIKSSKGKLKKKAYAYEIIVTKSWDNKETVYEDVFDSYSMDLNTFKAQMNVRLQELNDNDDGIRYYLASDSKNYYQTTDARKLQGVETVTISVTCHDGATLAEGTTQYKCGDCGKNLSEHTKQCSMRTSVSSESFSTSELDSKAAELELQKDNLKRQIASIENENAQLLKQISMASIEDAAILRQRLNENQDTLGKLNAQVKELEQQLNEVNEAIAEAQTGEAVQTDDYRRIPAIMQELKGAFGITWQDAGSWSGYTFIRQGKVSNLNGLVTFSATLSIARKPKYFLGIKIHRAIVQISWKLTSSYSDTSVADVITLDPGMDDKEKAELVNKRISEIAQAYPFCTISTEYAKTAPVEEDTSEDKYHLLWSSDRLEIAREVDNRLTKIYADLVSLEKMMSYKRDIIDVLKDIAPHINTDEGRKKTIIEECHERWMENGKGGRP